MQIKRFFEKITPFQLIIAICAVMVSATFIYRTFNEPTIIVTEDATPLHAPVAFQAGDTISLRVSAPEATDLYGYQFELPYDGTLFSIETPKSLLKEMPTIFKKDSENAILVGATMTGDSAGYSAESATDLCEIKLTALADGVVPTFAVTGVNVVSSDLTYTEDIGGWTCRAVAAKEF